MAIDTAKAGELKGEIAVTVGAAVTRVPVSATVKARKPGTPRLLVAGTPFERYATKDGTRFKGWTDVVDAAGLDVSYLLLRDKQAVLRDLDLSRFDAVFMADAAFAFQTDEDVKRVRAFAENGGRLVVATGVGLRRSIPGANAVLDGYGLEILDLHAEQHAVALTKDDFATDVVKAGVGSAAFLFAAPIEVQKGGRALVNAVGFDKKGLAFAATAKAGKGDITALGVPLWWLWVSEGNGTGQAKGSDNAKLLRYLLTTPRKG